jgi:hypothetical protein
MKVLHGAFLICLMASILLSFCCIAIGSAWICSHVTPPRVSTLILSDNPVICRAIQPGGRLGGSVNIRNAGYQSVDILGYENSCCVSVATQLPVTLEPNWSMDLAVAIDGESGASNSHTLMIYTSAVGQQSLLVAIAPEAPGEETILLEPASTDFIKNPRVADKP